MNRFLVDAYSKSQNITTLTSEIHPESLYVEINTLRFSAIHVQLVRLKVS